MIRIRIIGTRHDGERAAKRFGVNHIGFEPPGIGEGDPDSTVIGVCDDAYMEQVANWFNDDLIGSGSIINISGKRCPKGVLM